MLFLCFSTCSICECQFWDCLTTLERRERANEHSGKSCVTFTSQSNLPIMQKESNQDQNITKETATRLYEKMETSFSGGTQSGDLCLYKLEEKRWMNIVQKQKQDILVLT